MAAASAVIVLASRRARTHAAADGCPEAGGDDDVCGAVVGGLCEAGVSGVEGRGAGPSQAARSKVHVPYMHGVSSCPHPRCLKESVAGPAIIPSAFIISRCRNHVVHEEPEFLLVVPVALYGGKIAVPNTAVECGGQS